MTRFTKENLHKDGDYIFYAEPADRWNHKKHQFVARFKRMSGAGSFMPFVGMESSLTSQQHRQ